MDGADAGLFDVAVIGIAGRFPDAPDVRAFWRNLLAGVESVRTFSDGDLLAAGVAAETLADPELVRAAALLDDVDLFDAEFFGYSPREAELMDPQHRLFLECSLAALEDAGHDPSVFDGRIGVYGGSSLNGYLLANVLPRRGPARDLLQVLLGNGGSSLTTRVSYKLGLTGPSISVQTACSTSLVAVHLACQDLLGHRCDLALAGGVSVNPANRRGYRRVEGGPFSPDGRCRPFDAEAAGVVPGEGVGLVALRRLTDAVEAGDHVYAVVRASAVNNDGAAKAGFTAPGVDGQAAVIAEAHALAGVTPASIGYVEAHGTATRLGDPIEVAALTQAFGPARGGPTCRLGSVKANIGHLDAAAGVASLLKVVLALHHRRLPPSINCARPTPAVDWAGTPFAVQTAAADWPAGPTPRRAGVSAFGFGGTNAHLVLEEAPARVPDDAGRPRQLLVVSARSEAALDQAADRLSRHLAAHPEVPLADAAFTLQTGRRAFAHRRAVVAGPGPAMGPPARGPRVEGPREVAFLFPRGGVLLPAVSGALRRHHPAFRAALDECAGLPRDEPGGAAAALFALEYALARLWQSWGVRPAALLGDGPGELVAACLAGVLPVEDALRLAAAPPGAPAPALALRPPRVPVVSGAAGAWLTGDQALDPAWWGNVAGRASRLEEAVASLRAAAPARVILEVGPGRPLAGSAGDAVASLSSGDDGEADLLEALGRLWVLGVPVDWEACWGTERRRRVPLPGYPFQRRRCWIDPPRPPGAPGLVDGGVYLVANGLDDGGFRAAACLGRLAGARLVLGGGAPGAPRFDLAAEPGLLGRLDDEASAALPSDPVSPELERLTDELCAAHAGAFLARCGVDTSPGARHRVADLEALVPVVAPFERLRAALLGFLGQDGIATVAGGVVEFRRRPPDPAALEARIRDAFPHAALELDLLARCVDSYPDALAGRVPAIGVLFPEGAGDRLRPVAAERSRFSTATAYTRVVAGLLAELAARSGERPLRVLEVGAGEGYLTWPVAEALRGRDAEYTFTDLGRSFVVRAERAAAARGLPMRFATLDASRPAGPQGFARGGFDVVLAFDVVHATPDVAVTLGHLEELLAPGGLLVLLEACQVRRWSAMVWGLAEGWWTYADEELRSGSPLLSADRWESLLRRGRWHAVTVRPDEPDRRALADHVLAVAQRPGGPPGGDRAGALRRLGAADVLVVPADLSDPGQRLAVLGQAAARYGRLDGVVCDAGSELAAMLDDTPLGLRLLVGADDASRPGWRGLRWPAHDGDDVEVFRRALAAERPAAAPVPAAAPDAFHRRPDLPTPYVAPGDETEVAVAGILEAALGISGVGRDDDFYELGGDSLIAIQVANGLRETFGVELPAQAVLEHPTVAEMSAQVRAAPRAGAGAGPPLAAAPRAAFRARRGPDDEEEPEP